MLECPVCKENKASYYRCYRGALGKVMSVHPAIVDGVAHWRLLDQEDDPTLESFNARNGTRYSSTSFVIEPETAPTVRFTKAGGVEIHFSAEPMRLYNPLERARELNRRDDQFLVPLCRSCAQRAREKRYLPSWEFSLLWAEQCRCCGYFTLTEPWLCDGCPVCEWSDDFTAIYPEGERGDMLEEARENYRRFGIADPERALSGRAPRLEEWPRYHP